MNRETRCKRKLYYRYRETCKIGDTPGTSQTMCPYCKGVRTSECILLFKTNNLGLDEVSFFHFFYG
jgi:hypothetical protein